MSSAYQRFRSVAGALVAIFVTALACFYLAHADAATASIVLLLAVLIVGTFTGLTEALIGSLAAALLLDYYFIPPVYTLTVSDRHGWTALLVFLTASVLASNVSARLQKQRNELLQRQSETEKLNALSRSMLMGSGLTSSGAQQDTGRLIINKCMELFGFAEVALRDSVTGEVYRSQWPGSIPDELLVRGARALAQDILPIPLELGNRGFGSLAVRGSNLPEPTLHSVGNIVAIVLAQQQLQEAGSRAEAVRKSEELKSVMIDALAHDLKTPLTAIEAAAEMLLQPDGISQPQRQDLTQVIQSEAQRLRRMMDEAIHLARIDAKRLKLDAHPITVDEALQSALDSLGDRAQSHRIHVELPEALPPVVADAELLVQALKQLIDNALKYSPSHSTIAVSAEEAGTVVFISVRDHGAGLTELEQGRVFDKFYRGRYDRSAVQGTGMGLAIVKEIAEAHGGSIALESQVGQGSLFRLALPAAPQSV